MTNRDLISFCIILTAFATPATLFGQQSVAKPNEPKKQTLEEQITNADGFDPGRPNSHHKLHVVEMLPGYTYTIDMTAKFDTYLRLEDSKGKKLMENDDFNGLNSRMVFTPKKRDKYRIFATTFGQGATGFYTLTINPAKGTNTNSVIPSLSGIIKK